jgi:hypothetical protein
MKAIIAGGRDYSVGPKQRRWLDGVNAVLKITEVVSGGAAGADRGGEVWASLRGIPIKKFPADWKKHGKAAGPKRNGQMAAYCRARVPDEPGTWDYCILFPGGAGTANMKKQANENLIHIIEYQDKETT